MASNATTVQDEFGDFEDWIEVHNTSASPIDMGGMFLSDDLGNSTKWPIPAGTTIPANGYLLFWADDEAGEGPRHATFKLSAGGEDAALFDKLAAGNGLLDGHGYGPQTTDVGFGHIPNAATFRYLLSTPSPGASNLPAAGASRVYEHADSAANPIALAPQGPARIGGSVAVNVSSAPPSSSGTFFLGLAPGDLHHPGAGYSLVTSVTGSVGISIDGSGNASASIAVPNDPGLIGLPVYSQAWCWAAAGSRTESSSPSVRDRRPRSRAERELRARVEGARRTPPVRVEVARSDRSVGAALTQGGLPRRLAIADHGEPWTPILFRGHVARAALAPEAALDPARAVLVPQFVLFGPSLVGARVLLPLDILEESANYLPFDPQAASYRPIEPALSDLVFSFEPNRRFSVEAARAGRIPLWNPLNYCGTPFLAANHPSFFYPLRVIDYLFPGTAAIAWGQLAKAVLAGIGIYLFARRVLRVSFWPAAVGAALWPNVHSLVLWAGFEVSQSEPSCRGSCSRSTRPSADRGACGRSRSRSPLRCCSSAGTPRSRRTCSWPRGCTRCFRIADVWGLSRALGRRGLVALGALLLGWARASCSADRRRSRRWST
jgi:hypothetical protein